MRLAKYETESAFPMELTQNGIERRRWDRLPICVPMFVRWTDKQKRKIVEFASALNIGAGGVLLAMYRRAPIGTNLSIQIPSATNANEVPLSGSVSYLIAEVLRVEDRDKAHLVAARFAVPLVTTSVRSSAAGTDLPASV